MRYFTALIVILLGALACSSIEIVQDEDWYTEHEAWQTEYASTLTAQPTDTATPRSSFDLCHRCPTGQPTYSGATPTRIVQATSTPRPTATPTRTPSPTPPACAWARASRISGTYTFTGESWQWVRKGPGTAFTAIGSLRPGGQREVYWKLNSGGYTWLAIDPTCSGWVAQLGTLEPK